MRREKPRDMQQPCLHNSRASVARERSVAEDKRGRAVAVCKRTRTVQIGSVFCDVVEAAVFASGPRGNHAARKPPKGVARGGGWDLLCVCYETALE